MRDQTIATFLRSIAEDDDNTGRLALADWLEERGDTPRAEFLRLQCELASPDLAKKRRATLRARERQLLDEHRDEWVQAFGVPLEDVAFEGGLITRTRLSEWDGGKLLDADHAAHLVTLRELDLSGLNLGDAGLTAFATKADSPALRKLILSDNGITNAGAAALAKAAGLPRLETVYLFNNSLKPAGRAALEKAPHFRLATLDLGEREDGYCLSKGEAEMTRRQYVRERLLPVVASHFQTYPLLQSAMLCVAQYWADEADDAVHGTLIVSELFEPTMRGGSWSDEPTRDPNVPNTRIKSDYGDSSSQVSLWGSGAHWDDNAGAIPLWAAFAPEGGSQEYGNLDEAYAPAVMFYRHGGYEFLPMCRPHLDGIQPQWGSEE